MLIYFLARIQKRLSLKVFFSSISQKDFSFGRFHFQYAARRQHLARDADDQNSIKIHWKSTGNRALDLDTYFPTLRLRHRI